MISTVQIPIVLNLPDVFSRFHSIAMFVFFNIWEIMSCKIVGMVVLSVYKISYGTLVIAIKQCEIHIFHGYHGLVSHGSPVNIVTRLWAG
jgi:hypothetical protein